MFPDYRKTATERRDSFVANMVVGLCILAAVFYVGVFYTIAHFILKFW